MAGVEIPRTLEKLYETGRFDMMPTLQVQRGGDRRLAELEVVDGSLDIVVGGLENPNDSTLGQVGTLAIGFAFDRSVRPGMHFISLFKRPVRQREEPEWRVVMSSRTSSDLLNERSIGFRGLTYGLRDVAERIVDVDARLRGSDVSDDELLLDHNTKVDGINGREGWQLVDLEIDEPLAVYGSVVAAVRARAIARDSQRRFVTF
ncbi:MAG TPA: hypothetical protein VLF40_00390 [Candidatus Saccharimonadales bacterium]|nr:hypothetical protein [Candidatus Saccharimonadales bacterium]